MRQCLPGTFVAEPKGLRFADRSPLFRNRRRCQAWAQEVMHVFVKLIVAAVLVAHGLGHVMAPQSAFAPPGAFSQGSSGFLPDMTIASPGGRLLSLLWLVPLAGFLIGTYGLWTGQPWWQPVLAVSAIVSIIAVLPWWNVMPTFSYLGALAVDVLVLLALYTQWGEPLVKAFR